MMVMLAMIVVANAIYKYIPRRAEPPRQSMAWFGLAWLGLAWLGLEIRNPDLKIQTLENPKTGVWSPDFGPKIQTLENPKSKVRSPDFGP